MTIGHLLLIIESLIIISLILLGIGFSEKTKPRYIFAGIFCLMVIMGMLGYLTTRLMRIPL